MDSPPTLRLRARRRALRAAQIATLSLGLCGGGACVGATSDDAGLDAAAMRDASDDAAERADTGVVDSGSRDAFLADAAAGRDAMTSDAGSSTDGGGTEAGAMDAGRSDAGRDAAVVADAGPIPCNDPSVSCGPADGKCPPACSFNVDPDCCFCAEGFPGPMGGCAIVGPFVPPAFA